jgi:hypothetical protein
VGVDEAFQAQVVQEREALMDFYEAVVHAYKGERDLWARSLGEVMKKDPDNPYYRWIMGPSTETGSYSKEQ